MQTESFYDEILTCTTIISSFNSEKNYTITLDRDQMTPILFKLKRRTSPDSQDCWWILLEASQICDNTDVT